MKFKSAALPIQKYMEPKLILLVLVVVIGGIALGIYDHYVSAKGFSGVIERPSSKQEETYLLEREGEEEEKISLSVSPQALTEKQATARLDEAEKEIDGTVMGNNASLDHVSKALSLRKTYVQGSVSAMWSFSESSIIAADGSLIYGNLEKVSPLTMYATAKLSCAGQERAYTFPMVVVMPDADSAEGFTYYLKQALAKADEENPTAETITLPEEIGNVALHWSKEPDNRGMLIAALGLAAGVGIVVGRREEDIRKEKKRQRELTDDYPAIVSALSLYVSAGITPRAAFKRIFAGYRNQLERQKGPPRPGYEAIGVVVRKMEDGVGEEETYSELGRLTGNDSYGKLAMMLSKNVKRGQTNMAAILEKEEQEAFAERKIRARTLGEEASTKLLLPMMMLLGVVMVVMIAPAMLTLRI